MDKNKKQLHVMLIEDSQEDAELNVRLLKKAGYTVTYQRVQNAEEMTVAMQQSTWDLILSDYSMPHFTVEAALSVYRDFAVDIPFIVISGTIGEEKAVRLIKAGVHDYYLKNNMSRFIMGVERELREAEHRRELVKVSLALATSEEKYRSYIENAPDGVFVVDEKGKYIEVNDSAARMTGYLKDELLEMTISDLLLAESRNEGLAVFRELLTTGTLKTDIQFKHKNGTKRWWTLAAVKISETRFLGFTKEITQPRELEENLTTHKIELKMQNDELVLTSSKLAAASQKYTELYDFAPTAYFTLSREKKILELNHNGAHMLGSIRSQLINRHFDLFIAKKMRPVFHDFCLKIYKTKLKQICEVILEVRDLAPIYIHVEGILVGDENQCLVNAIDITGRMHAEELLQQTRLNYEIFFNTIDNFLFVLDLNGNIIHANDTVFSRLNYNKKEILGKSVLLLHPPERREEAAKIVNEMLAGITNICQIPLLQNNGDKIEVETRVSKGFWDGKPVVFGVSKDVSKLRFSEEKFSKLFQLNPSACGLSSLDDDRYIEVNEAFYNLLGFNHDEVIGNSASALGILAPDQRSAILKAADSEGRIVNAEAILLTKTGEKKYVILSAENISLQDESYRYTVVNDITKRKLAEQKLQESEATLATAQRLSHMGSWEWDLNSNKVKWSNEMFRVFDIDRETYDENPETIIKVLHPDDVELFVNSMSINIAGGDAPSLEYRVIHRDGSVHDIYAEGRREFDDAGKTCKIVGTVQDITHRKKAEEQLHKVNSFLDSIIDHIPDMVFLKDSRDLRFVRINKAGESLLGIPSKELIGKNDFDFFPALQAESFIAKDREVMLSRVMIDIPEEQIQTRHKGLRIIHTQKVPIYNSLGQPEYLLGISEDITELKEAEKAKKESEEKYKTMLNASPDGILLIDLEGVITEVSEIGLEILGAMTRDDLVGKSALLFVPAEERSALRDLYEKTMNDGLSQNFELKIRKKNHTLFSAEISTTLIQGPGGIPLSFMIIIRDISQRKKMETKQMHADRMANLGEMASGIAHEINQPLNIISMVMDKILFESSKAESVDIGFLANKSDKIFENITRIRNIIDHVRAFSRSHDDYVLTSFDINQSIANAVSMIAEQFKHLGITLNLTLESQIPLIFGNTYKFEQVIINLLVNAKDALIEKKNQQEDHPELIVGITTYLENDLLVVELTDNGIGIGNDDLLNVWLPFYTTKEEGKGTGLGLSICYQIVKAMDGTIEIASNRMKGTKIKIVLNNHNKQ